MAREVISGIYMIRNKLNDKVYIGQSKDILKRFRHYHWGSSSESDYALQHNIVKVIKDVGINNFEFTIIASGSHFKSPEVRTQAERRYIQRYHANDPRYGYNEDSGGQLGVLIPRKQSFLERVNRATPAFLYDTETKNTLLYMMGAKAISDDFGCDKAITSHSLNRGDIFSSKYYIIPARYNDRYAIVNRRQDKVNKIKDRNDNNPRHYTRALKSFERFMDAVHYIDKIAHEFGY